MSDKQIPSHAALSGDNSGAAGALEKRNGMIVALFTYCLWGVLPVYFALLSHVDALSVVAVRVVVSLVFVGGFVVVSGKLDDVVQALRNPRLLGLLTLSAVLVGCNWLLFVWAVTNHHILESSLGYFINPLMSIVIGMVFLRERVSRLQMIAIIIAIIGVLVQAIAFGTVPWLSLGMAATFALYGYVRKVANVGSMTGLMVETLVLMPISVTYLIWAVMGPQPELFSDPYTVFLLILCGPATAIPLGLFGYATRILPLSTMGMLQYVGPIIQFIIAIFVMHEALTTPRLVSFIIIWIALLVFSYDVFWRSRQGRIATAA